MNAWFARVFLDDMQAALHTRAPSSFMHPVRSMTGNLEPPDHASERIARASSPEPKRHWPWRVTITVFVVIGLARLLTLWAHEPLLAYANSYDQVRYTACFNLYPDRPEPFKPTDNSPWAPYSTYRFVDEPEPFCYWSSELLFQGANAAIYGVAEALGGKLSHDVRSIGALRITALLAMLFGFLRAHWQRGEMSAALAHAAIFAILFSDPGNALYLNGFYAEWTSLLSAYGVVGMSVLWRDDVATRRRVIVLGLLAFALSFSKIQHVVLPCVLGLTVLLADRWQQRAASWRAWALIAGGLVGVLGQVVQLGRGGELMESIRVHNQTHVVLTGLLPWSSDKPALLREMGVSANCLQYVGRRAWQLPGQPQVVCPGVKEFGRGKQLMVLMRHPQLGLSLFLHGIGRLQPWVAPALGQVENGRNDDIPSSIPNLGSSLRGAPPLFFSLLALPFLVLLVLSARRDWRRGRWFEYTVVTCVLMLATLGVTILGDGLADTPKQGHLVGNAAIAFLVVTILLAITRSLWNRRSG